MQTKKSLTITLVLLVEILLVSLSQASVRKLKVVVEPVQGEQDIGNNTRETKVDVVSQNISDYKNWCERQFPIGPSGTCFNWR